MDTVELKIGYIGGGSREWARKLMFDLALCPDLTGQVALYDIDMDAARLNEQFGNWLQEQPGLRSRWHYQAVASLEECLSGADILVLSIMPGPLRIMAEEIAIAEQYGLFFPVGDTAGATGLIRGLRAATIYAGFAEAIATHCPQAWVINYTNPMTICTRTLTHVAPQLKVFGCCHEVHGTRRMLAELAGRYLDLPATPSLHDVKVNVYGINHFTWVDKASYQGHDLLEIVRHHIAQPGVLREYTQQEVEALGSWFVSTEQIKLTLFQHFGVLAAAGDRHLVEFLPGFIRSPETLFRWGIIRTPVSWRIERVPNMTRHTHDLMAGRVPLTIQPTGEEGVAQIRALLGLGPIVTNVNVENQGQIPNLPLHAVVETNAAFDHNDLRPLAAGTLPQALHTMIMPHVNNQETIIEAALTRDKNLAFHAVYNDPTTDLPIDQAWEMFGNMLNASRDFLPGWKLD